MIFSDEIQSLPEGYSMNVSYWLAEHERIALRPEHRLLKQAKRLIVKKTLTFSSDVNGRRVIAEYHFEMDLFDVVYKSIDYNRSSHTK